MKKFKFISGNWAQSYFKDLPKYFNMSLKWKNENDIEEKKRVYSKKGRLICRCESNFNDFQVDHANAKLIATAPEMLEALIGIVKINWGRSNYHIPAVKKAIDVIERATSLKWEDIKNESSK